MRFTLISTTGIVLALGLLVACKTKEGPKVLPTVSTIAVSEITDSSATVQGNVAEEGSSSLESVGICWAVTTVPTRLDSHLLSGALKGDFQFSAKGLKNNTKYYVRTYATNKEGVSYGNELNFKTKPGWVYVTPANNPYVTAVITLNDQSVLIGSHSGIYKSIDHGKTWSAMNNGLGNLKVNCLIVGGNTVYAGTDGGVFRSVDGGANWNGGLGNLTGMFTNALAVNGTTLCAGTNNGVFVSNNSGDNWTQTNPIPGISNITLMAIFNDKIFAGSTAVKEIYSTLNQGSTWTKLSKDFSIDIPTGIIAYSPKLVVSTAGGLLYSSDQGFNFEKVPGFNAPLYCVNVSNNTIIAGGLGKTESFYRSKDFGTTFTLTENPGDNTVTVTCIAVNDLYAFVVSGNKICRMSL